MLVQFRDERYGIVSVLTVTSGNSDIVSLRQIIAAQLNTHPDSITILKVI